MFFSCIMSLTYFSGSYMPRLEIVNHEKSLSKGLITYLCNNSHTYTSSSRTFIKRLPNTLFPHLSYLNRSLLFNDIPME